MAPTLTQTIAQTCAAIKGHRFAIVLDQERVRPEEGRFEQVCRDQFLQAAQSQKSQFGKECLWEREDIQVMQRRLGGLPLVFKPRLSHYFAYNENRVIEASIRQCRIHSTPHLESMVDHEVGHHYDDILLESQFPHLAKWFPQPPSEPKYITLINGYLELFRLQVKGKSGSETNRALEDLFFLSNLASMNPAKRIQRLEGIWIYLAEVLRFGEEVFDARLKGIVLEKDFTRLFIKPTRLTAQEKNERTDLYLEHCLVAAGLEEAGLMEIFKKRPDVDLNILNSLERRHIDLFRLLIQAASQYFPVVSKI